MSDYKVRLYAKKVEAGMCGRCGEQPPKAGRRTCQACIDYINARAKARKALTQEERERQQLRHLLTKYQPSRVAPKKRRKKGRSK